MRKLFPWLLILLCAMPLAQAQDSFTVTDIQVEGLQRISPGTVFNYLPVKVGDELDVELSQDAVKALFKTGFHLCAVPTPCIGLSPQAVSIQSLPTLTGVDVYLWHSRRAQR